MATIREAEQAAAYADAVESSGYGVSAPVSGEGLRVVIEPIPGLSDKDVISRDGYFFQCPPLEEFSIDYAFTHTDYDTVRAGQFSRRGGKQLRKVDFDTLFVDQGSFALLDKPISIEDATDTLVNICGSGTPFLLTCAHMLPPGNYGNWKSAGLSPEIQMPATLRSARVTEKAGEGDARYVSVSFVEYRTPVVGMRAAGAATPTLPSVAWVRRDGTCYDGNTKAAIGAPPKDPVTLARLALYYYRDPQKWRLIASGSDYFQNWGPNSLLMQQPDFAAAVNRMGSWGIEIMPEFGFKQTVAWHRGIGW